MKYTEGFSEVFGTEVDPERTLSVLRALVFDIVFMAFRDLVTGLFQLSDDLLSLQINFKIQNVKKCQSLVNRLTKDYS